MKNNVCFVSKSIKSMWFLSCTTHSNLVRICNLVCENLSNQVWICDFFRNLTLVYSRPKENIWLIWNRKHVYLWLMYCNMRQVYLLFAEFFSLHRKCFYIIGCSLNPNPFNCFKLVCTMLYFSKISRLHLRVFPNLFWNFRYY